MKGKSDAQKFLYEQNKSRQFAICLRYSKSREEAEDILQDGFIKVFKNLHQYNSSGPLGAWISRVIVNTALMHIRKNKKMEFSNIDTESIADSYMVKNGIIEHFNAEAIMDLIRSLPLGYQTIFNMYAIEGYAHKEIAQKLDISESTSRTQFMRAKKALRRLLEGTMQT